VTETGAEERHLAPSLSPFISPFQESRTVSSQQLSDKAKIIRNQWQAEARQDKVQDRHSTDQRCGGGYRVLRKIIRGQS
jgi:hypothetical protein